MESVWGEKEKRSALRLLSLDGEVVIICVPEGIRTRLSSGWFFCLDLSLVE